MSPAVLARTRRDQIGDAALTVLADAGSRGLTHRAVDAQAGLPEGSTSNLYRTRDALIQACVQRLLERESAVFDTLEAGSDERDDARGAEPAAALVGLADAMLAHLLGPGRSLTLARHAIMAEAARRPALRPGLERATAVWWDRGAALLSAAGSAQPHRDARYLLACLDGLIADQLCRPQADFDARPALHALVSGLLAPVAGR